MYRLKINIGNCGLGIIYIFGKLNKKHINFLCRNIYYNNTI